MCLISRFVGLLLLPAPVALTDRRIRLAVDPACDPTPPVCSGVFRRVNGMERASCLQQFFVPVCGC
jgi:hypothetical protein